MEQNLNYKASLKASTCVSVSNEEQSAQKLGTSLQKQNQTHNSKEMNTKDVKLSESKPTNIPPANKPQTPKERSLSNNQLNSPKGIQKKIIDNNKSQQFLSIKTLTHEKLTKIFEDCLFHVEKYLTRSKQFQKNELIQNFSQMKSGNINFFKLKYLKIVKDLEEIKSDLKLIKDAYFTRANLSITGVFQKINSILSIAHICLNLSLDLQQSLIQQSKNNKIIGQLFKRNQIFFHELIQFFITQQQTYQYLLKNQENYRVLLLSSNLNTIIYYSNEISKEISNLTNDKTNKYQVLIKSRQYTYLKSTKEDLNKLTKQYASKNKQAKKVQNLDFYVTNGRRLMDQLSTIFKIIKETIQKDNQKYMGQTNQIYKHLTSVQNNLNSMNTRMNVLERIFQFRLINKQSSLKDSQQKSYKIPDYSYNQLYHPNARLLSKQRSQNKYQQLSTQRLFKPPLIFISNEKKQTQTPPIKSIKSVDSQHTRKKSENQEVSNTKLAQKTFERLINDQIKSLDQKRKEFQEVKKQIDQKKSVQVKAKQRIQSLQLVEKQLKQRISNLEKQQLQVKNSLSSTQVQIQSQQKNLNNYMAFNQTVLNQQSRLKQEVTFIKANIQVKLQQLTAIQKKIIQNKIQENQLLIQYEYEIKDLKEQIDQKDHIIVQLQGQIEALKGKNEQDDQLKEKLRVIINNIAEIKYTNKKSDSNLKCELQTLRDLVQNSHQESYIVLKQVYDKQSLIITNQQERINYLEQTLKMKENKLDQKSKEIQLFKSKENEGSKNMQKILKQSLDRNASQLTSLRNQIEDKNIQIKRFKSQIQRLNIQILQINQLRNQVSEKDLLKQELNHLHKKLFITKNNQLQHSKNEMNIIKEQSLINDLRIQNEKLKEEVQRLRKIINMKDEEHQKAMNESRLYYQEHVRDQYFNENQSLMNQLKQRQQKFTHLNAQNKQLSQKLAFLSKTLKSAQLQNQQQSSLLELQQQKTQQLSEQLQQKSRQLHQLKRQMINLKFRQKQEINERQEIIVKLRQEISQMKGERKVGAQNEGKGLMAEERFINPEKTDKRQQLFGSQKGQIQKQANRK